MSLPKNMFEKIAENRLKRHEYILLAEGENTEVWLCKQPHSMLYAFSITSTPWGVSVMGDIGNIMFEEINIGLLAGDDVGYYIMSKVSKEFKYEIVDCEVIGIITNHIFQLAYMINYAAKQIKLLKKRGSIEILEVPKTSQGESHEKIL